MLVLNTPVLVGTIIMIFADLQNQVLAGEKRYYLGEISWITSNHLHFTKDEETVIVEVIMKNKKTTQVRKNVEEGTEDPNRRQLVYDPSLFEDNDLVHISIRKKFDTILKALEAYIAGGTHNKTYTDRINTHTINGHINILLSLPGGDDQECHSDYNATAIPDITNYRGIVIPNIILIPMSER